jgi:uncharacterized protein
MPHTTPRLFLMALLTLLPATSRAASFNCSRAQTPREKAVCASPELSALDDHLNAAYTSARSALTPSSAALLRDDQRQWLQWLDRVCPPDNPSSNGIATCLTNFYNDRLQQLTTGRQQIHGIVVYPRAHFVFVPAHPQPGDSTAGNDPGFGYGQFAWPQIDNPTPSQRVWNEAVYAATIKASCCADEKSKPSLDAAVDSNGYVDSSYTLTAVNSRLIEVDLGTSTYGWGAAHPDSNEIPFAWWLDLQRPLKTSDIFAPNTAWPQKLATLTLAKLLKDPGPDALWKPGTPGKPGDLEKAIAHGVIDLKSWNISSEGLTITFGSYEVGPYSSGWPSATIPWQQLNTLLAPTLNPSTLPPPIRASNP